MEKLNLQRDKDDFYILEVNDNGDTVEFDLTDISLPEKICIASDNIARISKEHDEEMLKLQDEKDEYVATKKGIEIEKEKCAQMRKEFDSFMGEGACNKIFGDTNYYGMFLQLFDALEPHFEKMQIKKQKAMDKLRDKYLPKNNDVM